ncbi:hypothetical protein CIT292_09120 [Citrobacter youngae ATCC 29220]|uniref:Uncharacterized protein n=1 Tax=Citrobacter youngae ATCC 29220 TaxID=500640 RepID=D4BFV0_9ENTR|nr:hypothetical protein CIT292_09120 [Citrobacter youngae ATCC 29220]
MPFVSFCEGNHRNKLLHQLVCAGNVVKKVSRCPFLIPAVICSASYSC